MTALDILDQIPMPGLWQNPPDYGYGLLTLYRLSGLPSFFNGPCAFPDHLLYLTCTAYRACRQIFSHNGPRAFFCPNLLLFPGRTMKKQVNRLKQKEEE